VRLGAGGTAGVICSIENATPLIVQALKPSRAALSFANVISIVSSTAAAAAPLTLPHRV
jgi:hypothetical protein